MLDVLAWVGLALGIAMEILSVVKGFQRTDWSDSSTQVYFATVAIWLAGNVWIVWSCFHLLRFR
jgi:hypothetical protein